MKRVFLLLCTAAVVIFSSAIPALACWAEPVPFEIISGDGTRVFEFTPEANSMGAAQAAVYEIIDNERRMVYAVKDLSSFAYDSNFHFSSDMTHFARVFNESGIAAFETFSSGARTRVVMRNDFIKDYADIEAETSIGPSYTVNWRIEENDDAIIAIKTDEDDSILFDLARADFVGVITETPTEPPASPPLQHIQQPQEATGYISSVAANETASFITLYAVLAFIVVVGGFVLVALHMRRK
jgi:hypothetical protein